MTQSRKPPRIAQLTLLIGAGICLIIGLYCILYLYPAHRSLGQIQKQIARETVKLDRLKILFPVNARAKILEKIRFDGRLPSPERVTIPRKSLSTLPGRFSAAARTHGMNLLSSTFDINVMVKDSTILSVTLELSGELKAFRQLLVDFIAYACFDSVSALEIRAGKGETKSITLTLNIKIEKAVT